MATTGCGTWLLDIKKGMSVNKHLVPLKLTYFVMYAGIAMLMPYIPLFQKQLGMTTVESGIINGLLPFIGFLARPVFGMIADKLRRHKMVFVLCCLATSLFHMLLIMVPASPRPLPPAVNISLSCDAMSSAICQRDVTNLFSVCERKNGTDNINRLLSTQCSVQCFLDNEVACFDQETCEESLKMLEFSTNVANYDESMVPYFNHGNSSTVIDLANARVYNHSSSDCMQHKIDNFVYKKTKYENLQCTNSTANLQCQFFCEELRCLLDFDPYQHAFQTPFWSFFFIFLFAAIAYSPLTNLLDAMAYEMIGEKRHIWGQQRVWGTFGFVLLALLSGPILDIVLLPNGDSNYAVCFYIFSGFMICTAMISNLMKVPSNFRCANIMKNTCKLLRDLRVVVFLAAVFFMGFFFGVINTFLFWFLIEIEQEQNPMERSGKTVVGLALFCASGMEIPMIYFSGRIMKKIGEIPCISSAFVGYFIRFLAYYFLQNPWYVLPFELLHGVTFGLMFPAASMYASKISPPGMSATLQGLLSGTHFGFGWGMGALIGGVLYADVGARYMFLSCAITSLVALFLFVGANLCLRKPDTDQQVKGVYTVNGDRAVIQEKEFMADDTEPRSGDKEPPSDPERQTEAVSPDSPLMAAGRLDGSGDC